MNKCRMHFGFGARDDCGEGAGLEARADLLGSIQCGVGIGYGAGAGRGDGNIHNEHGVGSGGGSLQWMASLRGRQLLIGKDGKAHPIT